MSVIVNQVRPSGYVIRQSAHHESPSPETRYAPPIGEVTQWSSVPTIRLAISVGAPPG